MKKTTCRDAGMSWARGMVFFAITMLVCLSHVSAEEAAPSGDELLEELKAVHGKLDGFIAVYSFEAEKKRLEATLAMDKASGLGALRVLAEKVGEPVYDMKQWNTADDVVFVDAGGERRKITGARKNMARMLRDFAELIRLMEKGRELGLRVPGKLAGWQPMFLLGADSIEAGFGIQSDFEPFWKLAAKGVSLQGVDKGTVTFETKEHGLLTISREHGLLLRQKIKGKEGEDRVLELKSLVKNPGRDKVRELTAEWSTDGAEEMMDDNMAGMFGSVRMKYFQEIVGAVSAGKLDPGEVEGWLESQRERLRGMVDPWVREGNPYLEGDGTWAVLLDKVKAGLEDEMWEKRVDLRGGAEVRRQLRLRATRDRVREAVVQALVKAPGIVARASDEMFIGQKLEAADALGVKARDVILTGLTKAYLDAVFERKAKQAWGEVEE